MRRLIPALTLLSITAAFAGEAPEFAGRPYADGDAFADTWVATDGAGRNIPGYDVCGAPKGDRWVGIFYWTWHQHPFVDGGPFDNTKLLATARDGKIEWPVDQRRYHWGEPELGYYISTDPFVHRKHASMLADAGVDVVFFDTTNAPFTWKNSYETLCRTWAKMRAEGNRTPAIAFMCPFAEPMPVLGQIWKDLYQPGLWKDLWFQWEGKPLVLADIQSVKDPEMRAFFTFRRPMPDYWLGPSGPDQWSWLEVHPQHVFKNAKGEAEQMSVGVAQDALPGTPGPIAMSDKRGAMGRSWHDGARDKRENAVALGLNFEEQWRRALEADPAFLFVTGWNEWTAGRYTSWWKYTDKDTYFEGGLFVDEYDHEYSRDCEPMRAGHTDNYYYQLAAGVRRFKGVRRAPAEFKPAEIRIDGAFADWPAVSPEYRDTIGDVAHREHPGYGDTHYHNETGRNDFVIAKAAYDGTRLFFFVQTRERITARTDKNWMLLLLDADRDAATGWLGYDFVVNLEVVDDRRTTVKAWRDGNWQTVGEAEYRVSGNGMELAVPRVLMDRSADNSPAFDFHWADNIQGFGDVSELGVNGDSAPNRRWNYRYGPAAEGR